MPRTLIMFAVVLITALNGAPSLAGFKEGQEAYERGDYATALMEFRPLAEQDDASAQFYLAVMYEKGEGAPQDYHEAARWYLRAAAHGFGPGQHNLGNLYYNGTGVPQDYPEALKWFRLAAEQGDALAYLKLGLMYENGHGVPQDYVQAHKWYNLAGAAGETRAATMRDDLAKKMTSAQIAEAQRLAQEWKPKK